VSAPPVLSATDIVAGYERGLPIVRGVNAEVGAGEIVAVLGPNGAGKSTLIKAIAGLVPIFSGCVTLSGADITSLPAHCMVQAGLAFVPQTENVFARMSVADNLKLAAFVLPKAERAAQIEAVLSLFPDLAGRRSLIAGRLSGGQRQMLAIARALMVHPKVLMLDEPSAGLSPKLVSAVFGRLTEIQRTGIGVLLVEQNARAALAIADRAYMLIEGRCAYAGGAARLLDDPALGRLHLGVRDAAAPIGAEA
jgi:branched-chain amino acid transport system ATP-binding protein